MERLEFTLQGLKKFVADPKKFIVISTAEYLERNISTGDRRKTQAAGVFQTLYRRNGRKLMMNFGSWDNEIRYYILPADYALIAFASICGHKERLWYFDFDSEWVKAHGWPKGELEVYKKNYDDIDEAQMAECVLFDGVSRQEIYSMFPELINNKREVYPFVYTGNSKRSGVIEQTQLSTPFNVSGKFPPRALEGTHLFYKCWEAAQKIRAKKAGYKI